MTGFIVSMSRRYDRSGQSRLHLHGMHDFTRDTWTIEATDRKRERLRRISDDELVREMESAHRMCSPGAYWGERPREAYVIQRELVRLEICTPGAAAEEFPNIINNRPARPTVSLEFNIRIHGL